MALCENVYRRGGVYWWRRRVDKTKTRSSNFAVALSMTLREPADARRVGRALNNSSDRIFRLVESGVYTIEQAKGALKEIIRTEIKHFDAVAQHRIAQGEKDFNSGRPFDSQEVKERISRKTSEPLPPSTRWSPSMARRFD